MSTQWSFQLLLTHRLHPAVLLHQHFPVRSIRVTDPILQGSPRNRYPLIFPLIFGAFSAEKQVKFLGKINGENYGGRLRGVIRGAKKIRGKITGKITGENAGGKHGEITGKITGKLRGEFTGRIVNDHLPNFPQCEMLSNTPSYTTAVALPCP